MKEEEADKQWRKLNEFQSNATARINERPERDFQRHPWTVEDHENVARLVQGMTAQLARIEERLDVLYQMNRPVLGAVNTVWIVLAAVVIVEVIQKLSSWLLH